MLMLTRSDVSRLVPARTFSRGGIDCERTGAIASALQGRIAFVVRSSAFRLARDVCLASEPPRRSIIASGERRLNRSAESPRPIRCALRAWRSAGRRGAGGGRGRFGAIEGD